VRHLQLVMQTVTSSSESVDSVRRYTYDHFMHYTRTPTTLGVPSCRTFISGGTNNKTNSVAPIREGTIPTDRLPLVGEVSANLWG
jgi:hypothetical protein